jgi:hypothetical protein
MVTNSGPGLMVCVEDELNLISWLLLLLLFFSCVCSVIVVGLEVVCVEW